MNPRIIRRTPTDRSELVVALSNGAVNTDAKYSRTPPAIAMLGGLSAKNSKIASHPIVSRLTIVKLE